MARKVPHVRARAPVPEEIGLERLITGGKWSTRPAHVRVRPARAWARRARGVFLVYATVIPTNARGPPPRYRVVPFRIASLRFFSSVFDWGLGDESVTKRTQSSYRIPIMAVGHR